MYYNVCGLTYTPHMITETNVPNAKLSGWYFTVQHCKYLVEQRIAETEAQGWNAQYDRHHLERLEDMELFLKMSWDFYMDSLMDMAKFAMAPRPEEVRQ